MFLMTKMKDNQNNHIKRPDSLMLVVALVIVVLIAILTSVLFGGLPRIR